MRIISLIVSISFLFTATLYAYPGSKDSLRLEVGQGDDTFERIRQVQRAALYGNTQDPHLFIDDEFGNTLIKIWNFGPKGEPSDASIVRRNLVANVYPEAVARIVDFINENYPGADTSGMGIGITFQGSTAKGLAIDSSDFEIRVIIDDTTLGDGVKIDHNHKRVIIRLVLELLNEAMVQEGLSVRRFSLKTDRTHKVTFVSEVLEDPFRRRYFKAIADIFYINVGEIEPARAKVLRAIASLENPEELWGKIGAQWAQFLRFSTNKHKDRVDLDHIASTGISIEALELPTIETMCRVYGVEWAGVDIPRPNRASSSLAADGSLPEAAVPTITTAPSAAGRIPLNIKKGICDLHEGIEDWLKAHPELQGLPVMTFDFHADFSMWERMRDLTLISEVIWVHPDVDEVRLAASNEIDEFIHVIRWNDKDWPELPKKLVLSFDFDFFGTRGLFRAGLIPKLTPEEIVPIVDRIAAELERQGVEIVDIHYALEQDMTERRRSESIEIVHIISERFGLPNPLIDQQEGIVPTRRASAAGPTQPDGIIPGEVRHGSGSGDRSWLSMGAVESRQASGGEEVAPTTSPVLPEILQVPGWGDDEQVDNIGYLLDDRGVDKDGVVLNMGSGINPIVIVDRPNIYNVDSKTGEQDADLAAEVKGGKFIRANFYDIEEVLNKIHPKRDIVGVVWYDLPSFIRGYAKRYSIWGEAFRNVQDKIPKAASHEEVESLVIGEVERLTFLRHWSSLAPGGYFIIASSLYPISPLINRTQRFVSFAELIKDGLEEVIVVKMGNAQVAVIFKKSNGFSRPSTVTPASEDDETQAAAGLASTMPGPTGGPESIKGPVPLNIIEGESENHRNIEDWLEANPELQGLPIITFDFHADFHMWYELRSQGLIKEVIFVSLGLVDKELKFHSMGDEEINEVILPSESEWLELPRRVVLSFDLDFFGVLMEPDGGRRLPDLTFEEIIDIVDKIATELECQRVEVVGIHFAHEKRWTKREEAESHKIVDIIRKRFGLFAVKLAVAVPTAAAVPSATGPRAEINLHEKLLNKEFDIIAYEIAAEEARAERTEEGHEIITRYVERLLSCLESEDRELVTATEEFLGSRELAVSDISDIGRTRLRNIPQRRAFKRLLVYIAEHHPGEFASAYEHFENGNVRDWEQIIARYVHEAELGQRSTPGPSARDTDEVFREVSKGFKEIVDRDKIASGAPLLLSWKQWVVIRERDVFAKDLLEYALSDPKVAEELRDILLLDPPSESALSSQAGAAAPVSQGESIIRLTEDRVLEVELSNNGPIVRLRLKTGEIEILVPGEPVTSVSYESPAYLYLDGGKAHAGYAIAALRLAARSLSHPDAASFTKIWNVLMPLPKGSPATLFRNVTQEYMSISDLTPKGITESTARDDLMTLWRGGALERQGRGASALYRLSSKVLPVTRGIIQTYLDSLFDKQSPETRGNVTRYRSGKGRQALIDILQYIIASGEGSPDIRELVERTRRDAAVPPADEIGQDRIATGHGSSGREGTWISIGGQTDDDVREVIKYANSIVMEGYLDEALVAYREALARIITSSLGDNIQSSIERKIEEIKILQSPVRDLSDPQGLAKYRPLESVHEDVRRDIICDIISDDVRIVILRSIIEIVVRGPIYTVLIFDNPDGPTHHLIGRAVITLSEDLRIASYPTTVTFKTKDSRPRAAMEKTVIALVDGFILEWRSSIEPSESAQRMYERMEAGGRAQVIKRKEWQDPRKHPMFIVRSNSFVPFAARINRGEASFRKSKAYPVLFDGRKRGLDSTNPLELELAIEGFREIELPNIRANEVPVIVISNITRGQERELRERLRNEAVILNLDILTPDTDVYSYFMGLFDSEEYIEHAVFGQGLRFEEDRLRALREHLDKA